MNPGQEDLEMRAVASDGCCLELSGTLLILESTSLSHPVLNFLDHRVELGLGRQSPLWEDMATRSCMDLGERSWFDVHKSTLGLWEGFPTFSNSFGTSIPPKKKLGRKRRAHHFAAVLLMVGAARDSCKLLPTVLTNEFALIFGMVAAQMDLELMLGLEGLRALGAFHG